MEKETVNPILRQLRTMVAKQAVKDRTDRELLQQFTSERDESAFTELLARHGALVWNVCQRVLHHRHDAEDAFQATFLVLARQAGSVCKKEALGSWLHGVAYRTALSQKRADQRRRRRENQEPSREVEQPASAASLRELQALLDEELARLPVKYRAPFVLCCLEGKSYAQAARELGRKEGTVSSRLAQARKLLQDRLIRRGVTLSSVLCATAFSPSIEAAPAALVAATSEGVLLSLRGTTAAALSAQAVILANGATKTLSATARKCAAIVVLIAVPMAGVGLWAQQQANPKPPPPPPNAALPPEEAKRTKPTDDKADFADAEMHVIGVYWGAKQDKNLKGSIEVEVRPTEKPIVLVLTSYFSVEWHIKLAEGARIKTAILSGEHAQEIKGLPADLPVVNRSYIAKDGKRRKENWFWAYRWNLPQWREMVRRLNEMTGLPVATFQGEYVGDSFIVDGKRGRDKGQNGSIPCPPANKQLTPQELLAASTDAELHVAGMYMPQDLQKPGKPIDVDVRATDKPLVLVLSSYFEAVWNVKCARGARIKAVLVGGYFPQEIEGLPADVPVQRLYPDASSYYFVDRNTPRQDKEWFYAYQWNTPQWREMMRRLNAKTGLPVATFQGAYRGDSFTIDGKSGRDKSQHGSIPRPRVYKELTPQQLLAASADAELHLVGTGARLDEGKPVDVEVRSTAKPIVLVLMGGETIWNVKCDPGARIKAVLVGGDSPQEIEGLPEDIPVQRFCPDASSYFFSNKSSRRDKETFFADRWNTTNYRRSVEQLNDLTGLLVSTFQGESSGDSFVVDGKRGSEFAQKERKSRPKLPKEPTPQELRAASAGAELNVVSIYMSDPRSKSGDQIDVEVRATDKPIVLALASYMTVLWNVKMAPGARVKAVILAGYFEQEFAGIPTDVPIVYRAYFPSQKKDYFFGHTWNDTRFKGLYEGKKVAERLKDLTGLRVSTFQGKYEGTSFVVDGKQGRNFDQKQPKEKEEDPLADVADIPSKELRAGDDADKRYFLIGPKKDTKQPANGYNLLVILPGGDGSADFHPFVKRLYKNALPDGYLAAQPLAIKWIADQQIVWPTKKNRVAKMKFSTEEFIDAVIEDAAKKYKIDRDRVFTLSWSSSGPAAYAASLRDKNRIKGSFIAMSVFRPRFLPPLKAAKDHAYYLYHSPGDRVCPYRMAEQAKKDLAANGGKVRLETYEGGHGWRGNVYEDIRQGVEWLEKQRQKERK